MRHYKILMALMLSVMLFSCREDNPDVFNPEDELEFRSWSDVFESYWNGMNYSYAFWSVDPTDWDAVYRKYKPLFKDLKFGDSEDSATVKKLFGEITENLVDHHYTLQLLDKYGNAWARYDPGVSEAMKRDYFHSAFSEGVFMNAILINSGKGRITDFMNASATNEIGMSIYSYCIDNSIVYLRLSLFGLLSNLNNSGVKKTLSNFFDLIDEVKDLKGIIIDTRCNGGGYLDDMYFLLSSLTTKEVTFGYTRTKNGMGRLDYTPWAPLILYPISQAGKDFEEMGIKEICGIDRNIENVPIVSLVDIWSMSMGEMTPMAISALPNGIIIGERTFGGHGPLNGNLNDNYAGAFANKAFSVYTSTSMWKRLDGKVYEGIGVIPDIEALCDEEEFVKGNDTQLERAIQYINTVNR